MVVREDERNVKASVDDCFFWFVFMFFTEGLIVFVR